MAQKQLYTMYAAKVNALCLRYMANIDDAEDLTLEVMAKVFDKINRFSYQGEGSLYAWIRKMAVNMSLDKLRKRGRLRLLQVNEEICRSTELSVTGQPDIQLSTIRELLCEIPDTQRVIMNLYCIEGYSHKEIADKLGITEKASSSLLSKAKRLLLKKMNE